MKKVYILLFTLVALLTLASCRKDKTISLSYDKAEVTVKVGEQISVKPTVTVGKDVEEYNLTYLASNSNAEVSSDGMLTAKKAGTVTIIVRVENSTVKAEVKVIIEALPVLETYTIYYSVAGGILPSDAVTSFKEGEAASVVLPTPTREGYTFLGWYENDQLVETLTDKDYELVAKWEKVLATYTISYDVAGGILPSDAVASFKEGEAASVVLPTPTREGYTFLGWYEEGELVEEITEKNYELVAEWEKLPEVYSIEYDVAGGVLPSDAVASFVEGEAETVVLPIPTREGYTFLGWYENGTLVDALTDKNYELVAEWEKVLATYTISYTTNGGTLPSSAVKSFKEGEAANITLPVPTRLGYDFLGWYENDELVETLTDKSYKLVAKWEGQIKQITYVLNSGELSSDAPTEFKVGEGVTLIEPTREGYTFEGWYTNAEFTGNSLTKIPVGETDDVTLYASWAVETFAVTYELNGGNWTFSNREQIVTEFVAEFKAWSGKSVADSGVDFFDRTWMSDGTALGYNFLTHANYSAKWGWVLTYINAVRAANGKGALTSSSGQADSRGELHNFLNANNYSNFGCDYSNAKVYNGFWDTLSAHQQKVFGGNTSEVTLQTPIRPYYIFRGWYTTSDFSGEAITTASSNVTVYAKWEEEVPVSSVTITNKISQLTRFETHVLEWTLSPEDAAIKDVEFTSSDNSVATVDADGTITAVNSGTVTITIISLSPSGVTDSFTIEVSTPDYFDVSYETESYVSIGGTIDLVAEYVKEDNTNVALSWQSLDSTIATVDQYGTVTGVKAGMAKIRVSVASDATAYFDFTVTVLPASVSAAVQHVIDSHNSNIYRRYELLIGITYGSDGAYYADIIGSVSKLLFEDYVVHDDYYLASPKNTSTLTGEGKGGIDFITFHYAADMPYSPTATFTGGANLAAYNKSCNESGTQVSWHYSTGNDGVWHCQSNSWGAWHAGTRKTMTWTASGVTTSQVGSDIYTTDVTLGSDGYFYIKGVKTSIANTTSSTQLNGMGLAVKLVGSEWYLGGHYLNSTYKYISSTGGNNNSIGIESSVRQGSDLWLTWQYSAQLCASLLIEYELPLNRLVGHHFFSGKWCPQPMLENDLEIWYEFVEMVRQQKEHFEKYSDYTFEFSSDSEYLNDNGRVSSLPTVAECASYTITITNGSTTEEITLSTILPSIYTE